MSEANKFEGGMGSDAQKNPVRVVFITKKTSAKVKEVREPQVMSYGHFIVREIIAFELLAIVLIVVSLFWDAPLEQLANPLLTPNPAKAPWYFLGLQELLHYFPPIVAGILIPGLVIMALVVIPYFNVNIEGAPLWSKNRARRLQIFVAVVVVLLVFFAVYGAWILVVPTLLMAGGCVSMYFLSVGRNRRLDFLLARPLSWWIITWFIIIALILTLVGTFFRGPGWSWVWPWR